MILEIFRILCHDFNIEMMEIRYESIIRWEILASIIVSPDKILFEELINLLIVSDI